MATKTGAKAVVWPQIITQSTLKSWWNTNMKACVFGSFNSTQHRLITVMALSCDTPWQRLILLHAVYHLLQSIQTHTLVHTEAISTDGHYVFSGVFYLSLSFFITIFILIMLCPLKAQFKCLNLFAAVSCSSSVFFLWYNSMDVISLTNLSLWLIPL